MGPDGGSLKLCKRVVGFQAHQLRGLLSVNGDLLIALSKDHNYECEYVFGANFLNQYS